MNTPLPLNFALYFAVTLLAWAASLAIYVRITPYHELALVRAGNRAAAHSLSGAALGLALPLASLAANAVSLLDLMGWALLALAAQLLLWWLLQRLVFKDLRAQIEADNAAAGQVLGALAAGLGLINAACLTY